jgi:catechol 2,3-dioxygenase-like lactoylglutathione lyase family enzyme
MANTFHVSVYVRSIPDAVAQYRNILGLEPAKVRHDYAKFELQDPPVVLSLTLGGEPGTLSHLGIRYPGTGDVASEMVRVKANDVPLLQQEGTTCCYAKADKFWVRDTDGIPWEMYTLLDVHAPRGRRCGDRRRRPAAALPRPGAVRRARYRRADRLRHRVLRACRGNALAGGNALAE